MNITWKQDEPYRFAALVDDYVLKIEQPDWPSKGAMWEWIIFGGSGEYKLLSSWETEEDQSHFPDAALAKAAAEQALINYLKEKTTAI